MGALLGLAAAFALWRLITAIDAEDTPVTRRRNRL
jgi:hypothetical protein